MKVVLQKFLIASSLLSIASATEIEESTVLLLKDFPPIKFKDAILRLFGSRKGEGEDCIVAFSQCNITQGLGCQSASGKARSSGTCQKTGYGFHETCGIDEQSLDDDQWMDPCKVDDNRTLKCKKNPSYLNSGRPWCIVDNSIAAQPESEEASSYTIEIDT